MHRSRLRKLVLNTISATVVALMSLSCAYASDYQQQLNEADKIRTSDIQKFSTILDNLQQHFSEMSAYEQASFQYFELYRKIIRGQIKEAIAGYEQLIESEAPEEIKLRSRLTLVNAYSFTQDWKAGLEQLGVLIISSKQITNSKLKDQLLMVAATFYNSLGQYQLGLDYSQQLKSTTTTLRGQCAAAHFEVEAAFGLNNLSSNSDLFAKGIEKCQQANEAVIIGLINNFKIRSLLKEQNYQAAMSLLTQQLPQIENTRYTPLKGLYYSLIAEAAVKLEQWDVVKKYGELAAPLVAQGQSYQSAVRTYRALYEYYVHVNGTTAALEAYKKYAEADKTYVDDIQAKSLAFQLAQHQSIEQQNRIELLDQQNKLLQLQQQLIENESRGRRDILIALFCVIAMLILIIVQSRRSQRHFRLLAQRDGLTGVFNRRHFTHEAHKLLKHALGQRQRVSCIMFDLDYFKQLNDTQGHGAGDAALKSVAEVAKQHCRPEDIMGRIGGEEFCIILPNTSQQQAVEVAERLRGCFEQIEDANVDSSHTITASFGVSETFISGYSLEILMHDTDLAMYNAKSEGRNRVVAFFEQLRLNLQPVVQ
ncbi:GGDEF domain-containing protein [Shewanella avicenniae]|uniref:diguanylate cyclase n=1 Tax=Shewanella avicenniae TaxID=2814294 RepID=A0ABX7QV05_9GAMM|nr:GGDEF domain-containing protein [Shewanella avicenniae]QSX34491.1 GGDEF domain-containing protein [Shewanella avicenniae]